MCGGMGYTKELPTGRLLADALLYKVGAGTQEVRRTLIGRSFSKLIPTENALERDLTKNATLVPLFPLSDRRGVWLQATAQTRAVMRERAVGRLWVCKKIADTRIVCNSMQGLRFRKGCFACVDWQGREWHEWRERRGGECMRNAQAVRGWRSASPAGDPGPGDVRG